MKTNSSLYTAALVTIGVIALGAWTPAQSAGGHSDADILAAITAVNDAEISDGNTALSKATNEQVKSFARHMVDDHTASNQKIQSLAASLHISPSAGSLTLEIKADLAKNELEEALKGAQFDQSYMTQQVDGHQEALTKLNEEQGGSDLRDFLNTTRSTVSEHLKEAQTIQAQLKS